MWDETPVPVPISVSSTGWKRHGDLLPGDLVFTPKGTLAQIVRVTEQVVPEVCYAVRFDSGEELIADAEHLWHTWTKRDRVKALKCTDEWRAARRAARASRALANPQKPTVAEVTARRNRERVYDIKPPTGAVRTTQEIYETQTVGVEPNHSIPCTAPIVGDSELTIEPYLFGLWLGDGYSSGGKIGKNQEDWAEMGKHTPQPASVTIEIKKRIRPFEVRRFDGLTTDLRDLGVLNNKRIPPAYLRASFADRLALLQGMCDTDGTCDTRGQVTIGFSNLALATDLLELLGSLGIKATMIGRDAKDQYGRGARHYSMKFVTSLEVFRLPRKAERQKQAKVCKQSRARFIKEVVQVPSVPMRCIQLDDPDGLYLVSRSFITTHNTSAMIGHFVSRSARYGKDHQAVWFRRSLPEIEGAQVQMQALLPLLGAVYAVQARTWTMPNGATLKLRYLENDTDAGRYQGHEYATLYLDELGTFPRPEPIDMLRATLRSAAGVPTQMVASANPGGPGHAWIKARYLDPAPPMTPFTGTDGQLRVFIPSRVTDNPALLKADPTYIDRLKASGPPWLVRAWLEGDWNATLEGDLIKAEWLRNTYRELPPRDRWQRVLISVDTAIKVGKDTDYTAMLVAAEVGGKVYLLDLAHGKWEFPALVARLKALGAQWSPSVVLVEDKGSGQSLLQQLNAEGWRFPLVPVTPTADKVTRMFTETGALEAGKVLLPEFADWVPGLVDECLTFPKGAHDDRVDALSQLLRYLREGVDLLAAWA